MQEAKNKTPGAAYENAVAKGRIVFHVRRVDPGADVMAPKKNAICGAPLADMRLPAEVPERVTCAVCRKRDPRTR
jgi:hypothetical protein